MISISGKAACNKSHRDLYQNWEHCRSYLTWIHWSQSTTLSSKNNLISYIFWPTNYKQLSQSCVSMFLVFEQGQTLSHQYSSPMLQVERGSKNKTKHNTTNSETWKEEIKGPAVKERKMLFKCIAFFLLIMESHHKSLVKWPSWCTNMA